MQEEITGKSVALIVDGAKMSEQVLEKALKKFLEEMQKGKQPKMHRGKQSLKQLAAQNAGLANIEITDQNIKAFTQTAKKYAEENENCFYVDTFDHPFMQRKDIFAADGSHFNRVGYGLYADIWREALKEELKKF